MNLKSFDIQWIILAINGVLFYLVGNKFIELLWRFQWKRRLSKY